jgi:hypothetical protein
MAASVGKPSAKYAYAWLYNMQCADRVIAAKLAREGL